MRLRIDVLIVAGFAVAGLCGRSAAGPIPFEPWVPQPHGGPVVFENLPNQSGGPGSDTAFLSMTGLPVWQRGADDFIVFETTQIARITWWGFYQETFAPPAQSMRIRIYENRPDQLPGDLLYEESFDDPEFFWTGLLVAGLSPNALEYEFTRELASPFIAESGEKYWLEVVQLGDLESHYRWEYSSFGDDYAFINLNVPDWEHSGSVANLAFRLNAVPEPSTGALCGLGALLIMRRRRT